MDRLLKRKLQEMRSAAEDGDVAWVLVWLDDVEAEIGRLDEQRDQIDASQAVIAAARKVKQARDEALDLDGVYLVLKAITRELYPAIAAYDAACEGSGGGGEE